ncbi:MAG: hypothetical protein ABI651_11915 [Verrucomicrobiota bacterium]
MKLRAWKVLSSAMLTLPLIGGFGCSGINASHSVSPMDFLLPGAGHFLHMQNSPPPKTPGTKDLLLASERAPRLALAR